MKWGNLGNLGKTVAHRVWVILMVIRKKKNTPKS